MGPFTLMDLIGNDINYRSTCSVFDAFGGEPRFRPSLLQQEMVEAGWLGRKTGRGFYTYNGTRETQMPATNRQFPVGSPHCGAIGMGGPSWLARSC